MTLDAKMISRTDAEALIPEEYSREIIQNVPQRSRLLPMMRRLPNMSRKQYTIPVLSALPQATFVNGEVNGTTNTAGQKSTTNAEWSGLTLTAEELAVMNFQNLLATILYIRNERRFRRIERNHYISLFICQ